MDEDEPGLPDVKVSLYGDADQDGKPDDANGDGVINSSDNRAYDPHGCVRHVSVCQPAPGWVRG